LAAVATTRSPSGVIPPGVVWCFSFHLLFIYFPPCIFPSRPSLVFVCGAPRYGTRPPLCSHARSRRPRGMRLSMVFPCPLCTVILTLQTLITLNNPSKGGFGPLPLGHCGEVTHCKSECARFAAVHTGDTIKLRGSPKAAGTKRGGESLAWPRPRLSGMVTTPRMCRKANGQSAAKP